MVAGGPHLLTANNSETIPTMGAPCLAHFETWERCCWQREIPPTPVLASRANLGELVQPLSFHPQKHKLSEQ